MLQNSQSFLNNKIPLNNNPFSFLNPQLNQDPNTTFLLQNLLSKGKAIQESSGNSKPIDSFGEHLK